MRAAVVCDDLGSDYTDTLTYMLYDSDASIQAAYDYVVEGYTGGSLPKRENCDDGQARGRWYSDSVEAGQLRLLPVRHLGVRMWWTTDGDGDPGPSSGRRHVREAHLEVVPGDVDGTVLTAVAQPCSGGGAPPGVVGGMASVDPRGTRPLRSPRAASNQRPRRRPLCSIQV